jgi:hypothetical protein
MDAILMISCVGSSTVRDSLSSTEGIEEPSDVLLRALLLLLGNELKVPESTRNERVSTVGITCLSRYSRLPLSPSLSLSLSLSSPSSLLAFSPFSPFPPLTPLLSPLLSLLPPHPSPLF